MRRLLALALLLLAFVSCGSKYELLAYQDGNLSAVCLVNGEYKIKIEKTDDTRSLSILEPSALSSVCFIINNEECVAICDGAQIPFERQSIGGIVALCSIFDLDGEAMTESSIDDGEASVSFLMDGISYAVSYGKDNLPTKIQISSSSFLHEVEILELTRAPQ